MKNLIVITGVIFIIVSVTLGLPSDVTDNKKVIFFMGGFLNHGGGVKKILYHLPNKKNYRKRDLQLSMMIFLIFKMNNRQNFQ